MKHCLNMYTLHTRPTLFVILQRTLVKHDDVSLHTAPHYLEYIFLRQTILEKNNILI